MTIDSLKLNPAYAALLPERAAQGRPSAGQEDFAALLEGAAAKETAPKLSLDESSAALLSASLLGRLQAGQATAVSELPAELPPPVDEEVGDVLDILEAYMNALGNPQKTLKDISPLAEDLSRGAAKLDKLGAGLAQDDPLKPLVNDTAVLAAVEAFKFKRGDFV
ncbi:MAG: hypothetical protein LBU12_01790 [Deltaproteobacteria bacterium]|jgi:hypothetical protein|nr:hypothetical protein [Deltaproteobacteria bacterium]